MVLETGSHKLIAQDIYLSITVFLQRTLLSVICIHLTWTCSEGIFLVFAVFVPSSIILMLMLPELLSGEKICLVDVAVEHYI